MSIPGICFASQRQAPDTIWVMGINHYRLTEKYMGKGKEIIWEKTKKTSYISAGATVSLRLADGREISQVQLEEVGKDYIIVTGK